ncbi:MAG TPA: TIR domain-containing protein [Thermotogota bacterium]|nr:TIR domain-containing protein [Thermotogota bacterium]
MIDDGNSEDTGGVSREQKPFIFLSYGHDAYSVLAVRLKKDLEAQGYEVWYDLQRLKAGVDWEQYIEEGLEKASRMADQGFMLFLMTHHSARRPDGFCLNELAKACAEGIRSIIPVLVQYGSKPPLSICRLQYLDIQDCLDETLTLRGDKYAVYAKRILEVLRRERPLDTEGGEAALRRLLQPIDFSVDRLGHQEFSGREWVFKRIQEWLETDTPKRVLWIKGKAGTGKTGLAIKICDQYEQVVAHHLCKAENQEKKKPENLVKSIAFQLSTQIPEYRERLLDARSGLEDTLSDYKDDPRTLFVKLIEEPLYGLRMDPGVKKVIVIDAVDEANHPYSNDITIFIRDEFSKTPSWLRLILTSRDDPLVNSDLVVYESEAITLESPDNEKDILHYLEKHLKPFVPEGHNTHAYAEQLTGKSQGMFLYAVEVVKSIRRRELKLEEVETFPIGMNDFYKRNYERRFPPNQPETMRQYEERVLPLLNVMAAALEPLDKETLTSVLGLSTQKEADRLYQMMGTLFVQTDEWITPVHKSLMDWLVSEAAGAYKIYPMDGHRSLAEYGWKRLKEKEAHGWEEPLDYEIQNLGIHLYASREKPEKDAMIRDRLDDLFSKTFAREGKGKLPQAVVRNLLGFVVTLRNEEDEIAFKRVLSQFMNNQKGRKNYDSIFRLAIFLRDRSDFYRVHTKPKWGRWLLDYQHTLIEELILSNPEVDEYNHAKAESLNRMGDCEKIAGNRDKALEVYEKSFEIMRMIINKDPDNSDMKRCFLVSICGRFETGFPRLVPVGLNCLFSIPLDIWVIGQFVDTLTDYDKNSLLGAFAYQKLGEVVGNVDKSESLFRESIRNLNNLINSGNTGYEIKNMLIKNHIHVGNCESKMGDLNKASEEYRKALDIADEQTAQNPENTEWKQALYESWIKIADIERERGNLDKALEACKVALEIAKGLSTENDSHTGWKYDLWESWNKVAIIECKRGNLSQALEGCKISTRILKELIALDPSQNNLFELQRNTWVLIGESGDKKANENVYLEAFSEAEKCNKPGELGFALTFRKKASIEKARGNNINAKELYEKCLEFAPDSFDIFDIYVELGKIEQILENPLS